MRRQSYGTVAGLLVVGLALLAIALSGCTPKPSSETPGAGNVGTSSTSAAPTGEQIRQVGSTTVLPIAEACQKAYNTAHPEVQIDVSGGGSGNGIKALIDGTCEIADSSREIKPEEISQAKAKGINPVENTVAYDGIAVIVNPANSLKELSVQKLSDIFSGKAKQWGPVGAKSLGDIQLITRDSSSGTYESFKEMVIQMNGKDKKLDYAPEALKQASNEAVKSMVAQTKGAIGYVGLGYVDSTVKVLGVIPLAGGKAVQASAASVLDGTYPVSRKLYCYTNGEPTGVLKEYLDWIKGPEGQAIVKEQGFIPLPSKGQ